MLFLLGSPVLSHWHSFIRHIRACLYLLPKSNTDTVNSKTSTTTTERWEHVTNYSCRIAWFSSGSNVNTNVVFSHHALFHQFTCTFCSYFFLSPSQQICWQTAINLYSRLKVSRFLCIHVGHSGKVKVGFPVSAILQIYPYPMDKC